MLLVMIESPEEELWDLLTCHRSASQMHYISIISKDMFHECESHWETLRNPKDPSLGHVHQQG